MNPGITQHSAGTRRTATELPQVPPLELENRPTVPTEQAAYYLNRRPQTLRIWAMTGHPIKPLRINGRLAWETDSIRRLLGMEGA
jgi:hypothetical protein